MFFFFSKIFSFLLSPFTWIGVLVLIAYFVKKPGLSKKLSLFTILIFFLSGNSFLADEFMRAWELPLTRPTQLQKSYDVGILLGGGIVQEDKANKRLIFRYNTDRLFQTIDLYKTGRIKNILISGGSGDLYERDLKEASLIRKYLIGIGIPDSVIFVDSVSDNTHENAVMCAALLSEWHPESKKLLITSAFHMRRAAACFNKEGITFDTFTTNKMSGKRLWNIRHLFIPDIKAILFHQSLLHEITGYIVYMIMDYI
ncbi:MAG: YdcF family protein [Bacteroidales bacterium]